MPVIADLECGACGATDVEVELPSLALGTKFRCPRCGEELTLEDL